MNPLNEEYFPEYKVPGAQHYNFEPYESNGGYVALLLLHKSNKKNMINLHQLLDFKNDLILKNV